MSAEQNKALVRRFFEAQEDVNRRKADLDALDKLLAPDFVSHAKLLPGQQPGREGYKRAIAELLATGSNTRYLIEDQLAEGDKVVTRLIVHAIHDRRELMGVAPSGREVAYKGIAIHRISEGRITEEWALGTTGPKLMRQRLEQELEQEMRDRERIEQELLVARRIQQASLPKEVPQLEGWQISPYFRPAREVGGDFYEFFELEGGRVGFAVGDATGKGVPAAFVMTGTCAFLGGVATASGASPGEVLARVNEAVLARMPANMFVTCFYAVLDPESGRLSYANAGHNLPCCRHEHAARELEARGMPLGLMPGMSYEEKETVLGLGESVLFYTDGLVEAHNPQGEMFGTSRLRGLMSERPEGGASLSTTLMEELERFTGEGWEQEDDITLLTLERSATRS